MCAIRWFVIKLTWHGTLLGYGKVSSLALPVYLTGAPSLLVPGSACEHWRNISGMKILSGILALLKNPWKRRICILGRVRPTGAEFHPMQGVIRRPTPGHFSCRLRRPLPAMQLQNVGDQTHQASPTANCVQTSQTEAPKADPDGLPEATRATTASTEATDLSGQEDSFYP